ncbi:hypothetical protein L593_12995 [Salinarchaeum sp. Harcht-Bsk1]|nr:hypothetical protein L593_12995 [Salinarchaeum sp. Harcht-Bsk1]
MICLLAVLGALGAAPAGATVPHDGGASSPAAEFDLGAAASALSAQQDSSEQAGGNGSIGSAARNGSTLTLSTSVNRTGDLGNETTFAVSVPAANGSATVEASRSGDRYAARVPVPEVVGRNATANLSAATVVASRGGTVVVEDAADLRWIEQTGPATFRASSLAIPADVRGIGDAPPTLVGEANGSRFPATVAGVGPNATLLLSPGTLAGVPANQSITADAVLANATVTAAPLQFTIGDAAGRATAIAYRDADPVVVQPLAHPSIGPDRIALTLTTGDPNGRYHVRIADRSGVVPVPASVVGAGSIHVRVDEPNGTTLLQTPVSAPARPTVQLRIANGSLHAPNPAAIEPYDGLLLRDGNVSYVPLDDSLAAGEEQPLPRMLSEPSTDAAALLVGEGVRPARVDLTVVPPPTGSSPDPVPEDPDEDAFVSLWLDVGAIVGLLFLAMVGSVLAVASVYGLRRLSPARAAAAGPRAVLGHFLFGGIGGAACIAVLQSRYGGPILGSVDIAGAVVGLGALLVGVFHGGLTATGIRLGLGTIGAWPTRRVIDETAVPVRIRFTDDEDGELPGEQTVEVAQATDGTIVETTRLAGTTTEVELPPGEYVVQGLTAERESEAVDLAVEQPTTPTPDPIPVHLTVGRPGLQVEVTDAQTGDAVPEGQVTVTTDREETKQADVEAGSVTTTLPIATGSVSVVVGAPGYDDATVEVPIEESLTTVDVALDPSSGTLVVSALVAGAPIADATVQIEPAVEDDEESKSDDAADPDSATSTESVATGTPPEIGVRTAEVETDEDGQASIDLPAGRYRCHLALDGPNADLFAVQDGQATVEPDAETSVAVYARFDWEPVEHVQRRAAGLQNTIQSVAEEATADPTIPLYFAGVTEALMECVATLPDAGQHFATSTQDPDEVAEVTVAAAEAALEAVGQAMQEEAVREVITASSEPVRISPRLDADPGALLAYLEQDLTVASVESRAHEVEASLDRAAERLRSVAPASAVVQKAVSLVPADDSTTRGAAMEFAALLLLDAAEQSLARSAIRSRFDGSA